MPFSRMTPEEKAARQAEKEAAQAAQAAHHQESMARYQAHQQAASDAKARDKEAKAREKLRKAFHASPAGQARLAFEAGAQIFQYEADVKSMRATVRPIGFGSSAIGKETLASRVGRGPVAILNAVCDEGWELVNGSFVFVETGQQSRNRALATGQQIAVAGTVVGYYLFKRNESHKKNFPDPWEAPTDEAVDLAEQVDED